MDMNKMETLHSMLKVKNFPKDLALVILFTLLCILFVLIPPLNETPIRIILGLALVLFLPGYALIATLFPRKDDLDGIERVALGFGLSIAITPLLGLALNFTPFGIRLMPILIALAAFTISLTISAWIRRGVIPEGDRFAVEIRKAFDSIKTFKADTKLDKILSVVLILSIVLAISVMVYVIVVPKEREKFTEFYVLGPGGKAEGYPTNLTVGEEGEVIIGIMNHEYATVTYQLEVRLKGRVLDEKSIGLMHNKTWEDAFTFKATKKGEDQKLEFLLYKNHFKKSVYGKKDHGEPCRSLHLWVDVKD